MPVKWDPVKGFPIGKLARRLFNLEKICYGGCQFSIFHCQKRCWEVNLTFPFRMYKILEYCTPVFYLARPQHTLLKSYDYATLAYKLMKDKKGVWKIIDTFQNAGSRLMYISVKMKIFGSPPQNESKCTFEKTKEVELRNLSGSELIFNYTRFAHIFG